MQTRSLENAKCAQNPRFKDGNAKRADCKSLPNALPTEKTRRVNGEPFQSSIILTVCSNKLGSITILCLSKVSEELQAASISPNILPKESFVHATTCMFTKMAPRATT